MEKRCANCKYVDGIGCSNPTGPCSSVVEGYPKWEPKETAKEQPASKTLLDEFAMAAMNGFMSMPANVVLDGKKISSMSAYATASYDMAHYMMAERARRDGMGNVKEVDEA